MQVHVLKNRKQTNKFQTYLKENIVLVHSQYNGFGFIKSNHYLINNKDDKDTGCLFCRQLGLRKRNRYSCVGCNSRFCVNCFTACHYKGALTNHTEVLSEFIDNIETAKPEGKRNQTEACRTLDEMGFSDIMDRDTDTTK